MDSKLTQPPDLLAVVLQLRATQALTLTQHMGRALQRASLLMLNPEHATQIHDESDDPKPITVSDVMKPGTPLPLRGKLIEGDTAWIRVTALDAVTAAQLMAFTSNAQNEMIVIDNIPWQIVASASTPEEHPWAGQDTYAGLLRKFGSFQRVRDFSLHFALPTVFKAPGLDNSTVFVPLPIPQQIFRSLRNRWNTFSPVSVPDEIYDFSGQHIAISHFDYLRTQPVMLTKLFRGFTGTVAFDFVLPKQATPQQMMLAYAILMLSEFAFYSGVGVKTTMGMGMVRPV
ncbi:MAG: CRISPR-associated endoribonuclease Cas6 [Chloroflexota bacterium]